MIFIFLSGKLVNGYPQHQAIFLSAETREKSILARSRRPRGNQITLQALICDARGEHIILTPSNESPNQAKCSESQQGDIVQNLHCRLHFPKEMTHLGMESVTCRDPNSQAASQNYQPLQPASCSPSVTTNISHVHSKQSFPATNCFADWHLIHNLPAWP